METPRDRLGCLAVFAFLALLGCAWAFVVMPMAAGVRLLNWIGAVACIGVGVFMLRRQHGPAPSVWLLVQTWIWVVCVAAGAYFLLHQIRPAAFSIDPDIQNQAVVSAIERRARDFNTSLGRLQLLDSAIEARASDRFQHNGQSWTARVSSVPPRRDSSRPPMVRVELDSPEADSEQWQLLDEGRSLQEYLLVARGNELLQLRWSGSLAPTTNAFNIIDYFYFALMVPGADIIKPKDTLTRVLVVIQFLAFVALGYREVGRGRPTTPSPTSHSSP